MEDLKHLRESAVDYYAALRSAYLLDREGKIRERIDRPRSELSLSAPAAGGVGSAEQSDGSPPPKAATEADTNTALVALPVGREAAAHAAIESAP